MRASPTLAHCSRFSILTMRMRIKPGWMVCQQPNNITSCDEPSSRIFCFMLTDSVSHPEADLVGEIRFAGPKRYQNEPVVSRRVVVIVQILCGTLPDSLGQSLCGNPTRLRYDHFHFRGSPCGFWRFGAKQKARNSGAFPAAFRAGGC